MAGDGRRGRRPGNAGQRIQRQRRYGKQSGSGDSAQTRSTSSHLVHNSGLPESTAISVFALRDVRASTAQLLGTQSTCPTLIAVPLSEFMSTISVMTARGSVPGST